MILFIEKLRSVCLRNLIFNTYQETKGEGASSLKIDILSQKLGLENFEVEFVISSLIFKGFIKGKIIHDTEIIFDHENPFPHLSEVFKEN